MAKPRPYRTSGRTLRTLALCAAPLLTAMLLPATARADGTFDAFGAGQYEHDSNVFALAPLYALSTPDGVKQLDDSYARYAAGFDATYNLSQQTLFLNGEGSEYRYQDFTNYDHYEFNGTGGWKWRIGPDFDGFLKLLHSRAMAQFVNSIASPASIDTQDTLSLAGNWQMTGNLRLATGIDLERLKAPQPEIPGLTPGSPPQQVALPDFQLRENAYHAALTRNTGGKFTVGLSLDYRNGDYTHGTAPSSYNYLNSALTVDYNAGARTRITAAAGYGRRNYNSPAFTTVNQTNQNLHSGTGLFNLSQQIAGHTSFNFNFTRGISSFAQSGGAELDTTWTALLQWLPTGKSTIQAAYIRTRSSYAQSIVDNQAFLNRKDQISTSQASWALQSRPWLQFKLYGNHQNRTSNNAQFAFNGNSIGFSVQIGATPTDDKK